MEQPKINRKENAENEATFIDYMEELDLKPKDFERGKILDVGSASAGFAKWAKDHGVSNQIYSIDSFQKHDFRERSKSAYAEARAIPFDDESFAMVVANHVGFAERSENPKQIRKDTADALSEMTRVLKPGGEIRFQLYDMKSESDYVNSVNKKLKELEKSGYKIEKFEKMRPVKIEGRLMLWPIPIVKIIKPTPTETPRLR